LASHILETVPEDVDRALGVDLFDEAQKEFSSEEEL